MHFGIPKMCCKIFLTKGDNSLETDDHDGFKRKKFPILRPYILSWTLLCDFWDGHFIPVAPILHLHKMKGRELTYL